MMRSVAPAASLAKRALAAAAGPAVPRAVASSEPKVLQDPSLVKHMVERQRFAAPAVAPYGQLLRSHAGYGRRFFATEVEPRTFYVKSEMGTAWVKLASHSLDVADLTKEAAEALKLPADVSLGTVTLQVADQDGKTERGPLDGRWKLSDLFKEKVLEDGASIVVKVAAAPAPAPGTSAGGAGSGTTASELYAALPYARLETIPDHPAGGSQVLRLLNADGEPVDWPNLHSNILFVRPAFREFFEREDMLNFFKKRDLGFVPHTLVRGIPGIGKSSFALYCLWRLVVEEKRHVLYDYPKGLDETDTLEFGSGPRKEAVYIADGLKPRKDAGVKLLVTSPRQDFFDEFKKDAVSFFMPEPTEEEMMLMRDTCFPVSACASATDEAVQERISRWGRVPRMVLAHANIEEEEMASTLDNLSEEPLRKLLLRKLETGSKKDVSFRVLHYKFGFDTAAPYRWPMEVGAARDYRSIKLRWATPYMEEHVWEFFNKADTSSRMLLLRDLFRDKAILQFSGTLWEKWCGVAMRRGSAGFPDGGFAIRRLPHASEAPRSVVHAPACGVEALGQRADELLGIVVPKKGPWRLPVPEAAQASFESLPDLQVQLEKAAADPAASAMRFVAPPSFASIDFWEAQLKQPCGSNASVSSEHDLVVQGERLDNGWRAIARAVLPNRKPGDPIIHLWLVPSAIFEECKSGPLQFATGKKKKSLSEESDASVQLNEAIKEARDLAPDLVQYAVLVPGPMER